MKYFFIINPISGYGLGEAMFKKVKHFFDSKSNMIATVHSKYPNHPFDIAKDHDLKDVDRLIVVGGDGTMHEVINGMLARKDGKRIPIGLLPAGTGNALMHDLNLLDASAAAQLIVKDQVRGIDLAKVSGLEEHIVYSFNIIGWGLPANINKRAEKSRVWKSQRYNIASLIEIFRNPSWKIQMQLDDKEYSGYCSLFLASSTQYTGNGMRMAPKAILDDGFFDIVILKKASIFKLIMLFTKIFKGNHIYDPIIEYLNVKSFTISTDVPQDLIIDGQVKGTTPIKAEVLKGYLEILM